MTTFSHAFRTGESDNLKDIGFRPSEGWEKVATACKLAPQARKHGRMRALRRMIK